MDGNMEIDAAAVAVSCYRSQVLPPNQSYEEMQKLLAFASVELESMREAAKAQSQLHEARVRHLEELLKTTRRERDEFRDQCRQLRTRVLSSSSIGSGISLQAGEPVASMAEPSRSSHSEMHRNSDCSYVSTMPEPTKDTLAEVHRKLQEQQAIELQQLQQLEMQHQHANHPQLDLRTQASASPLDFQHAQHPFEKLRQHLEIHNQHKDHLHDQQLHMDMVIGDRQPGDVTHGEVVDGADCKGASWGNVHLDLHPSDEQCLILDSPAEHLHVKLTQGLPSPHVDQHSPSHSHPHLEELHQQLKLHQQGENNLQLHLHQQQEPDQLLSHMQQGQATDSRSLHLQDEKPLRRQLSQRQDGLIPISGGLQGTNDGVLSLSVLQQHSSWTNGLIGMSSPPLPHLVPGGLSEQRLQSSCLQGGSVVASILSPLERFGDPTSSVLLPRPVHLPEPPESDPQFVLNSLPEKGKLFQAVMQAGPLLSTLLLSGPLPQWRHPPPPLDPEEIPRVSMGAAVGILPPVEQAVGLMAGHGSSLEQVIRLSTPGHSSALQNGFCH